MAFEKSKVLKTAEKFVAAGKIANAVDEYEKILKENPKEWNIMIQIGDLLLKVNRTEDAIEYFNKVAEHYHQDGFFLKAIAIYKRINKLDPNLTEICLKLADLYLRQGLPMDAKSQLQTVAHHHISRNQNKEAIEILKQLIEIEPDNLRTRHELAKTYKNEDMIPEAIQEYLEINEHLLRKNLLKESIAVLETAYRLDVKNVEVLRKILTLYTEQNEGEKAVVFMEESLREDPSNPELLGLISEAYAEKGDFQKAHKMVDEALNIAEDALFLRELKGDLFLRNGDLPHAFEQFLHIVDQEIENREVQSSLNLLEKFTKADASFYPAWQKFIELYTLLRQNANLHAAYGSLADAFISNQMYQEAEESLAKLIELDPDDSQHQEKLEFVRSKLKTGVESAAPSKAPKLSKPVLSAETLPGVPDLEAEAKRSPASGVIEKQASAPAKVAVSPSATQPVAGEENEFVSEHLIEADVFNKYGLIDKAVEQLRFILDKYPNSIPARLKLKEILLERGERDLAVRECIAMSRILRGRGEREQAEDLLSEARQIDPNSPDLETAFEELTSQPVGAVEVEKEEPPSVSTFVLEPSEKKKEPRPAAEISEEKVVSEILEATKPVSAPEKKAKKTGKKVKKTAPDLKTDELLGEIEAFARSIKTQSGSFRTRPASPAKPEPVAKSEPAEPPVKEEKAEEIEIEIEVEPASGPLMEAVSPETPSAVEPSEFEEIDFYISQEMLEDAQNLLRKIAEKHPEDAGVTSRLARIDEMLRTGAAVQEEPIVVSGDEEIEVTMEGSVEVTPSVEESVGDGEVPEVGEVEIPDISVEIENGDELNVPEVGELPEMEAFTEENLPDVPEIVLDQELEIAEPSSEQMPFQDELPEGESTELQDPTSIEAELELEFGELEDTGSPEMESSGQEIEPSIQEVESVSHEEEDADLDQDLSVALDAAFMADETEAAEKEEKQPEPEPEPTHLKEELFEEESDFFDLAAELEEGLLNVQSAVDEERPPDGQNYSLEEILTDFKKGVDKQLGTEDFDTRYNLGIAYKEMGLVDEAIAEFQIAAKDPRRFLECCSMLGLCFAEKGMPKLAMKWYKKGLDTPGYTEDEYQGLRFDLAQTYESMGEEKKALEIFQEVYGVNANYRSVSKKIKELQSSLKKS